MKNTSKVYSELYSFAILRIFLLFFVHPTFAGIGVGPIPKPVETNPCGAVVAKLASIWEEPSWFGPRLYENVPERDRVLKYESEIDGRFINSKNGNGFQRSGTFAQLTGDRLPYDGTDQDGMHIERWSRVVLTTLVTRFHGNGGELPESIYDPGINGARSREFVTGAVRQAYERQYASYANQGPERRNELETYQNEDRRKADRTLHFLTSSRNDFVSHLQVLVSDRPEDKLNVEEHYGDVPRKPGEVWVELGRLRIDNDIDLPFGSEREMRGYDIRAVARLHTWQKAYSYLNSDLKAHQNIMQTNNTVLAKLEKQGLLVFDKRPIQTKYGQEWILTQNREQMLRTEENLVRTQLIWNLRKVTSRGYSFTWTPSRNERDVLVRLGIIKLVDGVDTRGDAFPIVIKTQGNVINTLKDLGKHSGTYYPEGSQEGQAILGLQRLGPGIKQEPSPGYDEFYGFDESDHSSAPALLAPRGGFYDNPKIWIDLGFDHAQKVLAKLEGQNRK